jgi:hypothetical protein
MKILMVLTSHDQLGNTGRKTGFWLEEFAAPYFVFRDAGVELTLASPKGGQPPVDPKSDLPENQTPAMARFKEDQAAQKTLSQTVRLADMKADDFDTIFYVGGHGPMWDLVDNPDSIALIESLIDSPSFLTRFWSCSSTRARIIAGIVDDRRLMRIDLISIFRFLATVGSGLILLIAAAWGTGALYYTGHRTFAVLLGITGLIALIALVVRLRIWSVVSIAAFLVVLGILLVWWNTLKPSNS